MSRRHPLSPRQLEILRMIAEDKRDRDIADKLGISERTVNFHVSRILLKLGAFSRARAVFVVFCGRR